MCFFASLSPPLCAAVCCNTQQHTHTHRAPPPNSQSPSPPSGSTSYMSPSSSPSSSSSSSMPPSPSSPTLHHPRPRHCHHHHGTAQITPQMTTNGADCSSHGRYSISVVLPKLLVLEWTESRPLRPTRLPEVPRNRKIQHCHHHHRTAQITPQMTTNGTDFSSHGRYSILAAPPRLSVLR